MMKWLRYSLIALIMLLAIIFVLDNRQPVQLAFHVFAFEASAPLFVWIWGAFILGAVTAWLVIASVHMSSQMDLRKKSKEIEALRAERDTLKCESEFKAAFKEESS